jgi:hypothetical protein
MDLPLLFNGRTGDITMRRICVELADIRRFQFEATKAFGKLVRITRVSCRQANVEEEVKATPRGKYPNIANGTSTSIWARKSQVRLRNPERKAMLLEVHMALEDGVARLFFNGVLLCGWKLPGVGIVVRLRR